MSDDLKALIAAGLFVIITGSLIGGCVMSCREEEKKKTAVECQFYRERPTWISTKEQYVWYNLNCLDGSISNFKVTNEASQSGRTNPEH